MEMVKFKYRLDRKARIITWSVAGGIVLVGGLLWLFSPGEYLPAWFISVAVAVVTLASLSIPRSIRITGEAVEISCLVEMAHIPYNHLRSIRRAERSEFAPFLPLFASIGFFGWFGYWLDVRGWEVVKVYTSSWRGLVVIEDIYEQRYLVNADDPDALVKSVQSAIERQKPGKTAAKSRTAKRPKTAVEDPQKSLF